MADRPSLDRARDPPVAGDRLAEASPAGCDAFVSKPYLAQDLLDTIGRLLPDEA